MTQVWKSVALTPTAKVHRIIGLTSYYEYFHTIITFKRGIAIIRMLQLV